MGEAISIQLKEYLEKLYGKSLSNSEYFEYRNRLIKFFNLLIEIDQNQKEKSYEHINNGNSDNADKA